MVYITRLGGVVAALAALVVAAPVDIRDVSTTVYTQLDLFAQYSAAAYCSTNLDSPNTSVTCTNGLCPLLAAATTKSLAEFEASDSYGDTAGFLVVDSTNKKLVVSFRGSSSIENWIANLDFIFTDASAVCSGCQVHQGFWKAWSSVADTLTAEIASAVTAYPGYSLVFTGHSLGGALATIGATVLRNAGYSVQLVGFFMRQELVTRNVLLLTKGQYSYGAPRVGNTALANYITSKGSGSNFRVTHLNDVVPRLPPRLLGYSHPSPEYWITSGTGAAVTSSDIDIIQGVDSSAGNAGENITSVLAHLWYFISIGTC
ncbi:lipase family protein [Aspergillus brunneoviolaceus CBS 621.78]|uniref:Lipase n=1 Tax=Aspergillus brunneoviolaceus CBS 621.78 TaxID=1450534 RepID=A0ACD1GJ32_9EURO|nr:lipase [Aspergillus brunneoviolaceus CBS 621.78]RAH49349.1 lipase [Aspergillus brunneoviolaceus CBS 621.78]